MKNKLKDLTNLKYLSDAIVSFELKKYEVISKFAKHQIGIKFMLMIVGMS